MTAGTAAFLLDLFIMIYAMFSFFKDGEKILEQIFYYIPPSHEDEQLMLQRFSSITRATVKGTLVVGIIQGGASRHRILGRGRWRSRVVGNAHGHPLDCARNWSGAYLGAGRDLFIHNRPSSRRNTPVGMVRCRRWND